MPLSKAQRREADRSAQRSINALVAERAIHYRDLFFSKNRKRTPQTWSPTPLNVDAASLPVTPPPIPLVTTIYPVPSRTTSPQTTGDDMRTINSADDTDKRPITQEQALNETTKQPDNGTTSIENIVAAHVIAYKKSHERRNPPYIEVCAFAQTILEIRGYARDGYILKTQYGDLSSIKIHVNKKLNADQVICGEIGTCDAS